MAMPFDVSVSEVIHGSGSWAATVAVVGIPVWETVGIEALDEYQATGKALHLFAARLRSVLEDPPEYEGL